MSSEVFRKVGRGGAGNFFSKKDVEEVEEAAVAAVAEVRNLIFIF